MGIRVWPVIEGRDKYHYFAGFIEWKWLTDCVMSGVLWAVADQLKVTPLDCLEGATRQDAIDSMGLEEVEEYEADAEQREDGFYYEGLILWQYEREWFAPQSGLRTVRALLHWIESHSQVPDDLDLSAISSLFTGAAEYDADGFAYILRELEAILIEAENAGQRFYLACDA